MLGVTGWMELKHLDRVTGKYIRVPSLTKDQVNWLLDWDRVGGRAWLFISIGRADYLFTPEEAQDIFRQSLLWETVRLGNAGISIRSPAHLVRELTRPLEEDTSSAPPSA